MLGAFIDGKSLPFQLKKNQETFCGKDSSRRRMMKILSRENYLKKARRQESSGYVERMVKNTF